MSKAKVTYYGISWGKIVHAILNPDLMAPYDIEEIFLKKGEKASFWKAF
jgi:hypothetical protein